MAVQIWIGEKPEHPNERRAITQLATQLARLDGLYVVMVNFSVGGRTVDVVLTQGIALGQSLDGNRTENRLLVACCLNDNSPHDRALLAAARSCATTVSI